MVQRAIFLIVLALTLSSCEFWEVDKCLDRGGRWNHETKECEYGKSPQPNTSDNEQPSQS